MPWYAGSMDTEESSVQLADLLQRLSRRLRGAQMSQLAPLGLTPAQERALRLITFSEEPLRMTELAERLRVVPRSVTTVIDALEHAGLVRRAIDPANRRAIRLHLTDKGTAVREEMRQARRQASEDLFAPLSAAERDQLIGLLSILDDPSGDRTQAAGRGGAGRQLRVRRVADFFKAKPVRWQHGDARIPGAGRQHLGGPARRFAAVPHPQQGTDQGTDHVVTERVRHHRRLRQSWRRSYPVQAQE